MRFTSRHNGFTLASLLIVLVVIGILSAMMMISSNEAIANAKAAKILANLQMLRRATIQWYADNRDKVVMSSGTNNSVAGMVLINGQQHPIQECSEKDLQLGKYLSNVNRADFNIHYKTEKDANTGKKNTNLKEGCYGICDGGTENDSNGKTINHRSVWYVGYRFTDGEAAVREKIRGRMKSAGVFLGTADAHKDEYNDNSAAVWMRAL